MANIINPIDKFNLQLHIARKQIIEQTNPARTQTETL